jgi:hypothetical protein
VSLALLLLPGTAGAQAASTPVEVPATALPLKVDSIRIKTVAALWQTEPAIILRELPFQPGDTVTPELWELALARLWNTGLFSEIDPKLIRTGDKVEASFVMEERVTLNPLLKYVVIAAPGKRPVWWFHVGASDPNLFGKFLEAGAMYEMFGNNPGGSLWFHNPRLFEHRLDGWFQLSWLPRPRPGFVLFRGTARAQISYEINDSLVVLGRVDGILDRFIPPVLGEANVPVGSGGAHVSGSVRFGRVDTIRLLQKGWSVELQPMLGAVTDPTHPTFFQGWGQFLGFIPLANRLNFAFRVQSGWTTDAPPQDRYYITGLDHVRGLDDNAITANGFALANIEVRVVAFDSMWLAFMPTAFIDGVVAQQSAGGFTGAASVGIGVRSLIPRFVGTGLRIDGAQILGTRFNPQLSVGVFQFF